MRGLLPIAALAIVGCTELGVGEAPPLRRGEPAKHPVEGDPGASRPSHKPSPGRSPWAYVLPVDHGIRHDASGAGQFRAPRGHGQHNGIDLLAPIGTPALSACNGHASSGVSSSFGRWVHVVCEVPRELAGDSLFASLFYAHLDEHALAAAGDWVPVMRGQRVGTVGKTGNARGASVAPHLHFEIAIHPDAAKARADNHAGADQTDTTGADRFFASLEKKCLGPREFESHASVRRTRRADPFVVLTCLDVKKPGFAPPDPPLSKSMLPWSKQYRASFDLGG